MMALRRQYNRRLRNENPFVRWVKLGKIGDVTSASVPPPATAEDPSGAKMEVEVEPAAVASTSQVPISEQVKAEPDSTNGLEAPGMEQSVSTGGEAKPDLPAEAETAEGEAVDEDYYWDIVDVDWTEVDLETKVCDAVRRRKEDKEMMFLIRIKLAQIQAIYNVCEWHFVDTDRFRRQLKWEIDHTWNIEPIGYDSSNNAYFYFDDSRLWIRRAPPVDPNEPKPKPRTLSLTHRAAPPQKRARRSPSPDELMVQSSTNGHSHSKKRKLSQPPAPSPSSAPTPSTSNTKRPRLSASAGRRASGRGSRGDDGWEEIPEELLREWGEKGAEEEKKDGDWEEDDEKDGSVASGGSSALTSLDGRDVEEELEEEEEEEPEEEDEDEEDEGEVDREVLEANGDGGNGVDEDEEMVKEDEGVMEVKGEEVREEVVEVQVGQDKMEVEGEPEAEEQQEVVNEDEEVGADGLLPWEREYWKERDAQLAQPGFFEWEAVCIKVEEYEAFVEQFGKTKDKRERALRDLIALDVLPGVVEHHATLQREREIELAQMSRKRSSRLAILESAAEEDTRIAAEQSELLARASRASRHKVLPSVVANDDSPAISESGDGAGGLTRGETREERLKKREEEKLAREAAAELAAIEEAKALAREEAIAANGGVVPKGMETPEELEIIRIQEEKEAKKREREEKKRAKEAEVKRARDERRKEKAEAAKAAAAAAAAAVEGDQDEPWFMDCELCKSSGWNLDDGSDVICCDRCEDWQHLDCHIKADTLAGRPRVDYAKAPFICAYCRADPARGPQKRVAPPPGPPRPLLPPPPPAKGRTSLPKADAPPPKPKRAPPKPKGPKLGPDGQPVVQQPRSRAKPRTSAPTAQAQPPRQAGSSNGASHPPAQSNHAQPPPQAQASGIPGPGQPPLDYPSLLALIKANPVLVNQLPPEYQKHFGTLLKIPIPYPAALNYQQSPAAAPQTSNSQVSHPTPTNSAPTPCSAPQSQQHITASNGVSPVVAKVETAKVETSVPSAPVHPPTNGAIVVEQPSVAAVKPPVDVEMKSTAPEAIVEVPAVVEQEKPAVVVEPSVAMEV
ncbi:hypothetical protein P7C70_g4727, partial [Phenoliferia sp. Uapishka_3]